MGRAVSRPPVPFQNTGASVSEINLEGAAENYEQFKKRWTEAYNTLQSHYDGKKSKEAEEAFETLQKSFQQMASLAELLQVENNSLKKDLEEMKGNLARMEVRLRESEQKNEEQQAENKQAMGDFQRQLEEIKESLSKAQAAGKAADDVTEKVNMVLSASSKYSLKHGVNATVYF